jgi:hypothetical protein
VMLAGCLQVPLALAAICVLGCASGAIGKGLVVESRRHRHTRANLFILGTAESGSGKSEIMRHVLAPILRLEKKLRDKFIQETKPRLQAELAGLQVRSKPTEKKRGVVDEAMQANAIRRMDELTAEIKRIPQIVSGDITSEKMGHVVEANNEMIFSATGEARNAMKNLFGKYTKNNDPDEALLLAGYSGDRCVTQRVHSGDIILESPCIALLWLIQPDKSDELYESDSLNSSGVVPRICGARTNARRQKRTGNEPEFDSIISGHYDLLIDTLLTTYRMKDGEPYVIQPDQDVLAEMREFHNSTITDDDRYGDLSSYVARWEENAWRISLILHASEHGAKAHAIPLCGEMATRGIEIQKWFANQQLGFLSAKRTKKRDDRKARVLDVIGRKFVATGKGVTKRIIQQDTGYNGETVRAVVEELLIEHKLERTTHKPSTGPSVDVYSPK